MPSREKLSTVDSWALLFAVLAIAVGVLTIRAITRGQSYSQILLLGMLTVYALSNSINRILTKIPHFKRLTAIPLGVVGGIAYLIGTPTDLPIFFVLLGIGSLVDLLWDPTGDVYDDQSG
ncbi:MULTISPECIES: hypothetical protein [Halorubrum]|uniref:hypothetical protein n=1 Tax=Halorubrum TaxID=56688 RepID=UPI0010F564D9|nr:MULTISPECIES: hypothetical protein [Halorubrum]TKX72000.1 hypothetical protein EXE40_05845 [Halorubrum sp. GN11GM_10-3_MGM]